MLTRSAAHKLPNNPPLVEDSKQRQTRPDQQCSTNMPSSQTSSQRQTPDYGRRLLVNIVDERAQAEPDREWVSIPRSSDPKDGWTKVTYKQAANAVNRVGHKLASSTGVPAKGDFPTIAYIGPSDVRYIVFALGAVKAGYKALFISPRNSQEGQLNLFELTNCHTIWFEATYKDMVQSWLQERRHARLHDLSLGRLVPRGTHRALPIPQVV